MVGRSGGRGGRGVSVLAVSSEGLGRPGSGQLLWAGFMTGGVIMRE